MTRQGEHCKMFGKFTLPPAFLIYFVSYFIFGSEDLDLVMSFTTELHHQPCCSKSLQRVPDFKSGRPNLVSCSLISVPLWIISGDFGRTQVLEIPRELSYPSTRVSISSTSTTMEILNSTDFIN